MIIGVGLDAKGDDDKRHLQPFEQDALKGGQHPKRVQTCGGGFASGAHLCQMLFIDGFFIMQRLQASVAQDRFLQPFQTKENQQKADNKTERCQRDKHDERRPKGGNADSQCPNSSKRPGEGASPVDGNAHHQHNRKRLDEFNGGCQESSKNYRPDLCSHSSLNLEYISNNLAHQAAMVAAEWIAKLIIPHTTTFKIMDQRFSDHCRRDTTGYAQSNLSGVAAHQVLEEAWLALNTRRGRNSGHTGAALSAERSANGYRTHAGGTAHHLLRHAHHGLLHPWLRARLHRRTKVHTAVRAERRARLKRIAALGAGRGALHARRRCWSACALEARATVHTEGRVAVGCLPTVWTSHHGRCSSGLAGHMRSAHRAKGRVRVDRRAAVRAVCWRAGWGSLGCGCCQRRAAVHTKRRVCIHVAAAMGTARGSRGCYVP